MAWIVGSATDYLDLSDQIVAAAIGSSLATLAVNSGGTGYVVGDIVTISGGTSTIAGQAEVLAVSSGVVTSVRISNAGVYSVNPGTGAATTGGTGSGLTLDTTIASNGWAVHRSLKQIGVTAVDSITNGGTGYSVSDVITLDSSGDGDITAVTEATFTVTSVSSGVVTGLSVLTPGEYSASDGGAGGVATTGGGGSGLIIDPTFFGFGTHREVILEGEGISTTEEIFIGWQAFRDVGGSYFNFGLFGLTGYSATLSVANQAGVMPGRFDDQGSQSGGAYVPLRNATMNYWLSVNGNRIIGVVQVGSNYSNFYMGFLNRFSTDTEFPYPLYISGCTSDLTLPFSSSDVTTFSGMTDPIGDASGHVGPGCLLRPSGSWANFRNGYSGGAGSVVRTSEQLRVVSPCGMPAITSSIVTQLADDWMNDGNFRFQDVIPISANTGSPAGSPTHVIKPTPDTGGDLRLRIPATLIESSTDKTIYGEMDGVFWFPAFGGLISQDRLLENGGSEVFRVFQNGNRTEQFSFFCIEER